jgi:hypothetical protein
MDIGQVGWYIMNRFDRDQWKALAYKVMDFQIS